MSFTFTIHTKKAVPIGRVWSLVGHRDMRCIDNLPNGDWPLGISHWLRMQASSRTTEIERTEDTYGVRIFSCGTLDDWRLGVRLAAAFSEATGARITAEGSEDDESWHGAELSRVYDEAWVSEMARSGPSTALYMAKKDPSMITFGGVKRAITIGPRTVQAMEQEADPELALIELHRQLQWLDAGEEPTILDVTSPSGKKTSVVTLIRGPSLLPQAAHVAILAPSDELFMIPWSALDELLGPMARWWGDAPVQLPAVTDAEWAAVLERARRWGVDPLK